MPKRMPKSGVNKGWFKKGQTAWNKGSGRVQACEECGKLFHRERKQPYCSHSCAGKNSGFSKGRTPWNKGLKGYNKGHFISEETKDKISKALTGRTRPELTGSKHPLWRGGRSRGYTKGYKSSRIYREWRNKVFERDNWTCQKCSVRGIYLQPHHIYNWSEYPELRHEVGNGITLCIEHHKKFHRLYGMRQNSFEQVYGFLNGKQ